ncbi:MAG: hypothetical protein Q4F72_07555 [Desulfovibrionaceae bacterium]|nr:hypothetical protein [Desulfovibrionaceae bacterium]
MSRARPFLRTALTVFLLLPLVLCLSTASVPAEGLGKKPKPLEYSLFGLTLESKPAVFRQTLKKARYVHTKTEILHGMNVMSFTSSRRNTLFSNAYVASCPSTGRTVGVYVYGEDGETILALARDRFGIRGNDLARMPSGSSIGGSLRVDKKYRKDYPNVTVSFYKNPPFETWTLALESREELAICARQNRSDADISAALEREIEALSRKEMKAD